MKRQEAIQNIVNNLKEADSIGYKKEELAQVILSDLEELGMLAPLNDENYCYMDNDDRRVNNLFSSFHEWEEDV